MKQKSSTPTKRNRRGSSTRRRIILALVPVVLVAILGVWWFGLREVPHPNIVFISLESVRADHLGAYGYDRPTSPTLDALAREGVIYEEAHAVTSWTLTSHASMFTGLYPGAHQVTGPFDRLDDSYTTVAEVLSAQGYQCAGVISGPYLKKAHNLAQGFSHYNESASALSQTLGHSQTNSANVEAGLRHFINRLRNPRQPFFLFAYFWDPHYDYIPPSPFDRMFVTDDCEPVDVTDYETSNKVSAQCTPGQLAYVRSQYDGEIRWTDQHLERFFQLLKANDLWDDTVIIVTADHGEEFFEHDGKGHKNNLYVESIRVPLIIKHAGGRPYGRDARLVSHVDLFPTILDLAGVDVNGSDHGQGRSLRDPMPPTERPIFFELLTARYFPKEGGGWETRYVSNWRGVRQGDYKLVTVAEQRRAELYELRTDPAEQTDRLVEEGLPRNALLSSIQKLLEDNEAIAQAHGKSGGANLGPEALENLRSLGYIQ